MPAKRNVPGRRHPTKRQILSLQYGNRCRQIRGSAALFTRSLAIYLDAARLSQALSAVESYKEAMLHTAAAKYEAAKRYLEFQERTTP